MNRFGIDRHEPANLLFGILLFVICPFMFPSIGEQQYSYLQGLFFLCITWIALTIKLSNRKCHISIRILDAALSICLIAMMIHIMWIKPVELSVWSWVDMAGLSALYVYVRSSSRFEIQTFMYCAVIGGIFQCFYAGIQLTGLASSLNRDSPMTGSFLNPAPFAGYLATLASVMYATALVNRHNKNRIALLGAMLLFFCFVICLKSRAALFALIATIILMYNAHSKQNKLIGRITTVVFLVTFLMVLYRIREVSANGRLFIWENTFEMIMDHPLTGVGANRFKVEFPFYQAQFHQFHSGEFSKLYDGNTFLVFNEYLHVIAEMGCIIFILLLLPLCIIWKNKNASAECSVAFCGIVCLMIFGIFSYPLSILTIKILLVLFIAIIGKWSKQLYKGKDGLCLRHLLIPITSLFISISVYGTYIVYNWDTFKRQKFHSNKHHLNYGKHAFIFRDDISFIQYQYHKAMSECDHIQALDILNDAIKRVPVYGFYRQRANHYHELGEYKKAEKEYMFLIHLAPSQLDPALRLAMIYKDAGNIKDALELISPYMAINPKETDLNTKAILYEMKLLYHELECKIRHHPEI